MSHNIGCVLESGDTGTKSGKKYNFIQSPAINYFI